VITAATRITPLSSTDSANRLIRSMGPEIEIVSDRRTVALAKLATGQSSPSCGIDLSTTTRQIRWRRDCSRCRDRRPQRIASMLMVSVRRSSSEPIPVIGRTECQELKVFTKITAWLAVNS
jgi:hypothetical protein